MVTTNSWRGRAALMVAHCAGMMDLVALPVWMGTLIGQYGFDPQRAGGLITLFLGGVVISSLMLAPRFNQLNGRLVASIGYCIAALALFAVSLTTDYVAMASWHVVAGIATGAALSVTHGTIARSSNPHRLFATVGMTLGFFAICFLGMTPKLVSAFGGQVLFEMFTGVMAVAGVGAILAFPQADALPATSGLASGRLGPRVWAGIVGVVCLALVQALMFSFIERIGIDRGFGTDAVTTVLIALSIVNLFPSPLAALLQRHWPAYKVLLIAPLAQAAIALTIVQSTGYVPYAVATSMLAAVVIFAHPFAFGRIAQLDNSGRALAGTPAMMMIGSAIGPILGGTLVKFMGYGSLGFAAAGIALVGVTCFSRVREDTKLAGLAGAAGSRLP